MTPNVFVVALFVGTFAGCSAAGPPLEMSSEHFTFTADGGDSDSSEMAEGVERAEALYAAIASIVSPAITPTPMIHVRLNGDFVGQGPLVDQEGTIQLYRYSAAENGYWAVIAHEIVHAMAFAYGESVHAVEWTDLGFYDEGWAEYVALMVDPDKTGFPFYGFPEDVVVGFWVTSDLVPMNQLRSRHFELNQPCEHQAYPQRASWFRHVDEVYGRETALAVVYPGQNPSPEFVASVIGESVDVVDAEWQASIEARFAEIEDGQALADAYRARTSFYEPCAY